jgi:hypothetical protein
MKLMVKEGTQARGEWGYVGREGGPAAVGCGTVGLTFNFQAPGAPWSCKKEKCCVLPVVALR